MTETSEERLTRIAETGWHDHDDAEWLAERFNELSEAVFQHLVALAKKDKIGALSHDGLHDVSLLTIAQRLDIVPSFDFYHHAPRCPANHWSEMTLPHWTCNCGARAAGENGLNPDGKALRDVLTKAGITDPQERRQWFLGKKRGLTP